MVLRREYMQIISILVVFVVEVGNPTGSNTLSS